MSKRYTVRLSDSFASLVSALAESLGLKMNDVFREAIGLYAVVVDELQQGNRLTFDRGADKAEAIKAFGESEKGLDLHERVLSPSVQRILQVQERGTLREEAPRVYVHGQIGRRRVRSLDSDGILVGKNVKRSTRKRQAMWISRVSRELSSTKTALRRLEAVLAETSDEEVSLRSEQETRHSKGTATQRSRPARTQAR